MGPARAGPGPAVILVPFRDGEPHRDRNWSHVHRWYEAQGFEVLVGSTGVDGFSRTQAILDARAWATADVLVVSDADVICDDLGALVEAARDGWAVPDLLHRLSPESTERVLEGEGWHGLPLSTDNGQDSKPYRVHEGGTLLAITAEAFDAAPPDPRFVGWGQEDDAWAAALRALVGPPTRVRTDVAHLWHPAAPRRSRSVGNDKNRALARRYRNARRSPAAMTSLIEQGRLSWQTGTGR